MIKDDILPRWPKTTKSAIAQKHFLLFLALYLRCRNNTVCMQLSEKDARALLCTGGRPFVSLLLAIQDAEGKKWAPGNFPPLSLSLNINIQK